MNKIKEFHKSFNDALARIEAFRTDPPMSAITEFLLNTEINPYSILGDSWGGSMDSAQSFDSLLGHIHHALFDDGDICFPVVNGQPRIVFASKHDENIRDSVLSDTEKGFVAHYGSEYTITFLNTVDEFVAHAKQSHIDHLRRCFFLDAETFGVDTAEQSYTKYATFSKEWVDEFNSLDYIDSAEQFKKSFGRVAMRKGLQPAIDLFECSEWYDQEWVDNLENSK